MVMVRDNDYVAVFHSVHRVMKAEKLLKQQKLDVLLIPTPRQLSSDCGLAIRYDEKARPQVDAVLAAEGLVPVEVYRRQGDDYELIAGVA